MDVHCSPKNRGNLRIRATSGDLDHASNAASNNLIHGYYFYIEKAIIV